MVRVPLFMRANDKMVCSTLPYFRVNLLIGAVNHLHRVDAVDILLTLVGGWIIKLDERGVVVSAVWATPLLLPLHEVSSLRELATTESHPHAE